MSHAIGYTFRVGKLKDFLTILLPCLLNVRSQAALDILVVKVVKEAIRAHDNEITAGVHLVLIVEGLVWQLTSCATLIRKVKAVLLLLRPERLSQDQAIITCILG